MYTPSSFAETDPSKLFDLIEQHSFATVVSWDGGEPTASHLPLLLDRGAGPWGRLLGHMARANSQWCTASGQRVLVVFHGPHAYISPTWYESERVVPTWNYIAVHAYGTLRVEDEPSQILDRLRETVARYEQGFPRPWLLEQQDAAFMEGLLPSIVAFAIDVDRLEGKWKLNQNHSAERRQRVVRALQASPDDNARRIAEYMSGLE